MEGRVSLLSVQMSLDADCNSRAVKVMHAATAEEHFAGPDGISELHGNGTMIPVDFAG